MAVILNIDTSTNVCSTALTAESMVLKHYEDFEGHNHATVLSRFIKGCLDFLSEKELHLDAISVSIGPGSYTGLRIGLSEAKGLAYALGVPLIGISTLKIMATSVMFAVDPEPDAIFVPMIDARRMEVYTAAYDMMFDCLYKPQPLILSEGCLDSIITTNRSVYIFGDGSDKAVELFKQPNVKFVSNVSPLAVDMLALSDLAYSKEEFIDLAYSTPEYLKDFQATKPKKLI